VLVLALISILSTSYVTIGPDEIGQLSRVYWARQMPPGHIIGLNGEKGPQAEILGPGFHFRFLLNVLNNVEKLKVVQIGSGQYGKLVALDGQPLPAGQTFASQVGSLNQMLDAQYFLTHGGQKGPQIAVLTPGSYRINQYLWKVETGNDTDIDKGFVGVVKSNARSAVSFGNLSVPPPQDCQPTKETDLSGGKLAVPLVPVGCVGIWDRPLLPGRYYINTDVYQVTPMDTRVQTWEFKGGFTRRTIALSVDQQGKIEQKESEVEEPVKPEYADRAVFLKVEGWDIPQELRVLVQIAPDNAPIVVASVGDETEVEHRIIVPVVRSIVRDVTGGGYIQIEEMNDKGEMITIKRPPHVMDLLDHRPALEKRILEVMRPEGEKAGVEIKEMRFGDPAVPPELLVARLRQQLSGQLKASYEQEMQAQQARIQTENSRATADQQPELVKADIELARAERLKKAAQLTGEGEEARLSAIAEGQKAQTAVLGAERVVELRKYELMVNKVIDLADKHPEMIETALQNASKLVPNTVISTGGSGGIDGAAGILGSLLGSSRASEDHHTSTTK
jgi:hypothetical protein